MRRLATSVATGVTVAAMVLAACGGSSKPSTGAGNTSGSNSSGGGTTAKSSGNSDGGGNSDVSKANIKVAYTETDTDNTTTTLTFAQNGKGKSFFSSGDATATATIYVDGTTIVECQGSGATAQCTKVPQAEAAIGTSITAAFGALGSIVKSLSGGDKSSENIAGRDANCYKYKAQDVIGKLASNPIFKDSDVKVSDYDPSDTSSICLDKQTGWPLRFAGTKKGAPESQLSATAVSEPSDSEFNPPVTPAEAPSIPGVTTP